MHLKIGWQERTEADLKNGRHRRDQDGLRKRLAELDASNGTTKKEQERNVWKKKKQTHGSKAEFLSLCPVAYYYLYIIQTHTYAYC